MRKDCKKPKGSRSNCGPKVGHVDKTCLKKKGDKKCKDKSDKPKRPTENAKAKFKAKTSNKSDRRKKVLREAMSYLAEESAEEADEDDSVKESEDDEEDYFSGMVKFTMPKEAKTTKIILDTGCNGAHVFQRDAKYMVQDRVPTSKEVHGVTGKAQAESIGKLGRFGRVLVMPNGQESLLSVMELVKASNGSFRGDQKKFEVLDKDGKVILSGENDGDGFWRSDATEVEKITCLYG